MLFKSAAIAFSMYSRLPVPQIEWDEANMKYVFCFFPLIGVFAGALEAGWYFLACYAGIHSFFYAAVSILIIILLTGGIHLDGYMDVHDASAAFSDMEKKHKIMKDPHTGAFAVIHSCLYMLLTAGIFAQTYATGEYKYILIIALGYSISRSLCVFHLLTIPSANHSGVGYIFQTGAGKSTVLITQIVYIVACLTAIAFLSVWTALFIAVLLPCLMLRLRFYIKKQFGGITGDLAGFSLVVTELSIGFVIVLEICLKGVLG